MLCYYTNEYEDFQTFLSSPSYQQSPRVPPTSHEPLIHLSNNKTPRVLPISATLFIGSPLVSNERSILPSSRTRAIFQPSRHLGDDRGRIKGGENHKVGGGRGGEWCIQCFFFFFFFCGAKNRGGKVSSLIHDTIRGGKSVDVRRPRFNFPLAATRAPIGRHSFFPARRSGNAASLFEHRSNRCFPFFFSFSSNERSIEGIPSSKMWRTLVKISRLTFFRSCRWSNWTNDWRENFVTKCIELDKTCNLSFPTRRCRVYFKTLTISFP